MKIIVEKRALRIDADDLEVRVFFLQVLAGAGDRAAGPHAADEVRNFALGIVPDFGAGRLVMSLRVVGVVILIAEIGVLPIASRMLSNFIFVPSSGLETGSRAVPSRPQACVA